MLTLENAAFSYTDITDACKQTMTNKLDKWSIANVSPN
jgi:hypothetical protein